MNPSSDIGPDSPAEAAGTRLPGQMPPANWRVALMDLIASRFALIELESKDAAKDGARRAALIAAACGCAVFAWALLLAGGISLIAESCGWPWNLMAIGAAVLHLLAGIILASLAKPSTGASFPVTRAEFHKDREWIQNLHTTKKSND